METAKFELWAGGDFSSTNIGPGAGDHKLGSFDEGPGFYLLVGPMGAGKSQHLGLLLRAQGDKLLRADANITDGENSAQISLAAMRCAFRCDATGQLKEPQRSGVGEIPGIEAMATPIDILINGGGMKGADERCRRRLQALLTYAPVASSPARMTALCAILQSRTFTSDMDPHYLADWWRLAQEGKDDRKAMPISPHMNAAEIKRWLVEQKGDDLLGYHKLLVARLNLLGKSGEYAASALSKAISEQEGRLKGVATGAWPGRRQAPSGEELASLSEDYDQEHLSEVTERFRRILATTTAAAVARQQEEERRVSLRAAHGARPGAAEDDELERLQAVMVAGRNAVEDADRAAGEATRSREKADNSFQDTIESFTLGWAHTTATWDALAKTVGGAIESRAAPGNAGIFDLCRVPEDLHELQVQMGGFKSLSAAVELAIDGQKETREVEEERQLTAGDHRAHLREVERLHELEAIRQGELEGQQAHWDEIDELLRAELSGPDNRDVSQVKDQLQAAESLLQIARVAKDYQLIAAGIAQTKELHTRIKEDATGYRNAAKASWKALGTALTEALDLPWLTLDGQEIILHYGKETGKLVETDTEPSVGRSIDDEERVSVGELRIAMLRLMLVKRDRSGGMIIVPWEVVAALDEEYLHRFATMVVGAGVVVLSERPRREGDPSQMQLEHISTYEDWVRTTGRLPVAAP